MKKALVILLISVLLAGCQVIVSSTNQQQVQPQAQVPTSTSGYIPIPANSPTPLPSGFYSSNLGFSLILPKSWSVIEDTSEGATFDSSGGDTRLMAFVFKQPAPVALSDYMQDYCLQIDESYTTYLVDTNAEITLADGSTAQYVLYTCNSEKESPYQFLTVFERRGDTDYVFVAATSYGSIIPSRLDTLRKIISTINLSSTIVFGLPRAETLLLLGYVPSPEDLDPAVTTQSSDDYIGLIYSGLVRLNQDLQVVPDLAESWTISRDNLTFKFTLRKGITFEDGTPITAADVKYSWERATDPDIHSPTASETFGRIAGANEKLNGSSPSISGIEVIDDRTIQVTLSHVTPNFLGLLTYPNASVISKNSIDEDPKEWMFHPNASGSFGLLGLKEGKAIIFERNDHYRSPSRIHYVAYQTGTSGSDLANYKNGNADIVYISYHEAQAILSSNDPLGEQLVSRTSLCTGYILFNNTLPVISNPNVRKALSLAIDKDELVEQFFANMAARADTILPPAMPGYLTPKLQMYDPQAAKQALAASGLAGQLPVFTLSVGDYAGSDTSVIDAIIGMWHDNLGVQVKVEFLDPQDYLAAVHQRHGEMVYFDWCANFPDPGIFLENLFTSSSPYNPAGYSNTQVDAQIDETYTDMSTTKLIELYQQSELQLLQDYAAIPLYHDVYYALVSPRVQGFVIPLSSVNAIPSLWLKGP